MGKPINGWQQIVEMSDVPQDKLPDILHAILNHLGLEIVEESTPDYTVYEVRKQEAAPRAE